MSKETKQKPSQVWIKSKVIDQNLCTGCGACVNLCPYQKSHRDNIIILHACDRIDGRCKDYCPRSRTDLDQLRKSLFDYNDYVPDIGPFKGLYMTRATDENLRAKAQHGGTVSALVKLALKAEFIDSALLSDQSDDHLSECNVVNDTTNIISKAGSKFVVSPTIERFNEISKGNAEKIGVVATPCQALALAKMRVNPWPEDAERIKKLVVVIGLFCGWALDWKKLKHMLLKEVGKKIITGMDKPC